MIIRISKILSFIKLFLKNQIVASTVLYNVLLSVYDFRYNSKEHYFFITFGNNMIIRISKILSFINFFFKNQIVASTVLYNVFLFDYSHSLGWYWELPLIPSIVINEKNILFVGAAWAPSKIKEHDFFIYWFLSNVAMISGWAWILTCFYSLFLLRDMTISSLAIRGSFFHINFLYFYFVFLGELCNIITITTSMDLFLFLALDNWLVKIATIYAWFDVIILGKTTVLQVWMHHIKRDKIFGTKLVRNVRARNRAQREAVAYLTIAPILYLGFYVSTINVAEPWFISDLWIEWFAYLGNWRRPYFNVKNSDFYSGNNYLDAKSWVSDHYPWWYVPGSKKGTIVASNPYSRRWSKRRGRRTYTLDLIDKYDL